MSLTKAMSTLTGVKYNVDEKGDFIPFPPNTVDLVYGGMEYARSVFGNERITRTAIINYFDNARTTWPSTEIPKGVTRHQVVNWCKEKGIKPLHYYTPMSTRTVWFREDADLFAFTLKFGVN
jgi:hypothetical protein